MNYKASEKGNTCPLSVIVVNYNGYKYAKKCIQSILNSNTKDLEIVLVDNGSSDGSTSLLKKDFSYYVSSKKLKILELDKNYGPARARNEGVQASSGEYISFLDNDTEVHPNWSREALRAFKENRNLGAVQCKLLLADRKTIDYVGEYIGSNGFLIQGTAAGVRDSGQFTESVDTLAAKSAGMFISRKVFDKVGGFDEDYFIYVEETDLGWRAWLAGYLVKLVPSSVVYHEFGTGTQIIGRDRTNYNAKFHGCKNYVLTLFKNLSTVQLLRILPKHLVLWQGLAWFSLYKGNINSFLWIYKALLWNLVNLPKSIIKRRGIQRARVVTDSYIFKGRKLMRSKKFSYFLNKVTKKTKIGNAESFSKINDAKKN